MARIDVVEIELGDIESIAQLHERLMNQLQFPDWYGKNWNAFWDAIVGLVDMPHVLRLRNWADFERRFPRDARLMSDCLCDMEKQLPSVAAQVERV